MNTGIFTIERSILLSLAAVAMLHSPRTAVAGEPIELKAKYSSGRTVYFETTQETDRTVDNPAQGKQKTHMRIIAGILQEVTSASADGVELRRTFDRLSVYFKHPAIGELEFDSDKPGAEENAYLKQMFGTRIGMDATITLNAKSEVTSCTGMEAIVKRIDEVAGGANPFWAGSRPTTTDEQHQKDWSRLHLALLPKKAVAVGDSWSCKLEFDAPRIQRTFVFDAACRFDRIGKEAGRAVAFISFEAEDCKLVGAEDAPQSGSVELKEARVEGTAVFDLETAELVKDVRTWESKVAVKPAEAPDDAPANTIETTNRSTTVAKVPSLRSTEKEANLRLARATMEAAKKAEAGRIEAAKARVARGGSLIDDSVETLMTRNTAEADSPWPQWGGRKGDFKTDAKGLADKWPEDGPKKLWSRDLGDGYSAIVSDGERLYTMYRIEDEEKDLHQDVVVALDPATGKTLWEHTYDAPFLEKMRTDYGRGPHATPLLVGSRLFTVGPMAKLHCLDKKTGSIL